MALYRIKENKDRSLELMIYLSPSQAEKHLLQFGEQPEGLFKKVTLKNINEY